MKAVLESLQSFLGRFREDKKPSTNQNGHANDAGYGGYGFPLLLRRSKPKQIDQQEKQFPRCTGERQGSSRRHRGIDSLTTLANSEPNLSPSHCNMSPVITISPPVSMAARIESLQSRDQSMGLTDCLVKMYSRRVAARKHADEPFDKYSSEYYSCGKKRMQNRRLACEFPNVNYTGGGVNVSANSSTSDSDPSESSCAEGCNVSVQGAQPIQLCGISWRSTERRHADLASPILNTTDDHNIDVEVQKMGVLPTVPTEKRDHLHDTRSECDVGFCSQHEYDEEELSAYSLSPARGNLRKKFPPPLNSYIDKRGQSPEACAAGYCLRSFRQDGRFVLQEVRAPTHKYFRVLREDGRLKLELIDAVDDSSQEDDETSAADICVGVKGPKVGVVTKVLYTSNTHAEDACKGTLHVGMHASCDEMKTRAGSNAECVRTYDLISTNVGVVDPLEPVELAAPHIQRNLEVMIEATNIVHDVGASVDDPMPLMFPKEAEAEDMVSPLADPRPSPRCPEMTTLYEGPSASIKQSWVSAISAF